MSGYNIEKHRNIKASEIDHQVPLSQIAKQLEQRNIGLPASQVLTVIEHLKAKDQLEVLELV